MKSNEKAKETDEDISEKYERLRKQFWRQLYLKKNEILQQAKRIQKLESEIETNDDAEENPQIVPLDQNPLEGKDEQFEQEISRIEKQVQEEQVKEEKLSVEKEMKELSIETETKEEAASRN